MVAYKYVKVDVNLPIGSFFFFFFLFLSFFSSFSHFTTFSLKPPHHYHSFPLSHKSGSHLRTNAANFAHQLISDVYLDVHRRCVASVDEWWDMTLDDVVGLVEEVKEDLERHRKNLEMKERGKGGGGGGKKIRSRL